MSDISFVGLGAVSPAGWSHVDLCDAVERNQQIQTSDIDRPGWENKLSVRRVPAQNPSPTWARHPRFRRTSPISRFAAAAALEALGNDAEAVGNGSIRLGVVLCVMAGCVNYTQRFFQEVLRDPSTASPLIFPETVFNAPASHLAALLGSNLINYTLVGDDTTFVHGLVTAAEWLTESRVDGCLVIGAEETNWLTADAMQLFDRNEILAEGAGAVYLKKDDAGPVLRNITSPQNYVGATKRSSRIASVRSELESISTANCLFESLSHDRAVLNQESSIWSDWRGKRISVRKTTGNAFNASSAWQTIVAAQMISEGEISDAFVSIAGVNQEAIGLSLGRGRQ